MKTPHTPTPLSYFFLGLSLLLGLSPATARADITGQWNFTDGLSAEIGQDLEWNFDQGEAKFGKGSAFAEDWCSEQHGWVLFSLILSLEMM